MDNRLSEKSATSVLSTMWFQNILDQFCKVCCILIFPADWSYIAYWILEDGVSNGDNWICIDMLCSRMIKKCFGIRF